MSNWRRLLLIGVLTLIVGLIVKFPARIAYHWFAPADVVAVAGKRAGSDPVHPEAARALRPQHARGVPGDLRLAGRGHSQGGKCQQDSRQ